MSSEIYVQLLLAAIAGIGAGFGGYGAIKNSIAKAILLAEIAAKDSNEAHKRLDEHIDKHHTKK